MNRKKLKGEYDIQDVCKQLQKLIIDENIISKQKCYLYTQYRIMKKINEVQQKKLQEIEKRIKEESNNENLSNMYEKENRNTENIINIKKENNSTENNGNNSKEIDLKGINKIEEDFDDISLLANKYEKYKSEYNKQDNNFNIEDIKHEMLEKDKKIIELENKVIKYQILNRTQVIKHEEVEKSDDLLDLKTQLEYARIEKERVQITANKNILEIKIKYDEFMNEYNKLKENYLNNMLKLEDLNNHLNTKKAHSIEKYILFVNKIRNIQRELDTVVKKYDNLQILYNEIIKNIKFLEEENFYLFDKLKKYKIFENKKNFHTGEEFYDEEIRNLLEVCDTLTEENSKLVEDIRCLNRKIREIESREVLGRFKSYSSNSIENIPKYLEDLNKQQAFIDQYVKEMNNLKDERDKLVRLNLERIKLIEKYKEDIKMKNIEILGYQNEMKNINNLYKEEICKLMKGEGKVIKCTICEENEKQVAIISCMHTFCKECVDTRIKLRNRKCPICGVSFNINDVRKIYL